MRPVFLIPNHLPKAPPPNITNFKVWMPTMNFQRTYIFSASHCQVFELARRSPSQHLQTRSCLGPDIGMSPPFLPVSVQVSPVNDAVLDRLIRKDSPRLTASLHPLTSSACLHVITTSRHIMQFPQEIFRNWFKSP